MRDLFWGAIMKKAVNILWGIWCSLACIFSPAWMATIYLNMTGVIYEYDYSMDEGTVIIIGLGLLILWIGLVAFPIVELLLRLFRYDKKYACIGIILMTAFCMVGVMACEGNPINFLIS